MIDIVGFAIVFHFMFLKVFPTSSKRKQISFPTCVPSWPANYKVPLAKANHMARSRQSGRGLYSHMDMIWSDIFCNKILIKVIPRLFKYLPGDIWVTVLPKCCTHTTCHWLNSSIAKALSKVIFFQTKLFINLSTRILSSIPFLIHSIFPFPQGQKLCCV